MGSSKKKDKDRDRDHKRKKRHRSRSPGEERLTDRPTDRPPGASGSSRHRDSHGHRDRDRDIIKDRDGKDRDGKDRDGKDRDGKERGDRETREKRHRERKQEKKRRRADKEEFGGGGYPDVEPVSHPAPGNDVKPKKTVFDYGHSSEPVQRSEGGSGGGSGGGDVSLSIAETNKLRAKLGLKPLDTPGARAVDEDGKPTKQEDTHVPAVNLREVKKMADIKEKLLQAKEKRRINKLLGKVKKLGDSDSDDDSALSWVRKARKASKDKEEAAKRAKVLQEMDEEFGVGDLLEQEFPKPKPKQHASYSSKHLKGLKIQHDQAAFAEGTTVILTLKDSKILDEEEGDTLINVNMIDDEKAVKYIDDKKKKVDYQAYDDPEYDEIGMFKEKQILEKYTEEIDGVKKDSFQLGSGGKYDTEHERRMAQMKAEFNRKGETLVLPAPTLASEFFTNTEMATFNKVKKKVRKIRKKAKIVTANDLLRLGGGGTDHGTRLSESIKSELDTDVPKELIEKTATIPGFDFVDMEVDEPDPLEENEILGPEIDLSGVVVEEDHAGMELELSLKKARRVKEKKKKSDPSGLTLPSLSVPIKEEPVSVDMEGLPIKEEETGIVISLNATSEFCRSLGEMPTYGLAGNRPAEEEDELLEFERELMVKRQQEAEEDAEGNRGWQSVEIDMRPVEIEDDDMNILDEEPVVGRGLGAAMQLAEKKGFLDKESKKNVSAPRHITLDTQDYSIEDKRYDDLDDKYRKRERFGGAVSDFTDKEGYKPNVKLEYFDDNGHNMNSKEAFRYLSHRFHGKGSGKKKLEKRQKKHEEEQLMKSMSSTDTPLGTVQLLQEKQVREKTAYITLSGGSKGGTAHISK